MRSIRSASRSDAPTPTDDRTRRDGGEHVGWAPVTSRAFLVRYFALTYALTWGAFVVAGRLPTRSAGVLPLLLLGSFGPTLVAVALTWRERGRAGVRALLARLLQWRVGWRWYVFALGYLAAAKLCAALSYRTAHGHWPHFGGGPWYGVLLAIVFAGVVGGPLGEEVGWRGYALPRLVERYGAPLASVVLGVLWAVWHLPLFLMARLDGYGDQYGQSFPTYLLSVVALSVAIAWLVGNTRGSLLMAVLMHSAINQTKDLVPSRVAGAHDVWALSPSQISWLTDAALWIGAALLLLMMRRRTGLSFDGAPRVTSAWALSRRAGAS